MQLKTELMAVLKRLLEERFVAHLPPLLGNGNQTDRESKQISRAFSAFVLQKLFDLDSLTAAKAVVDDFEDKGVDAIYYNEHEKTLYFVQSKLKANKQFNQSDAQAFLSGVKLLLDKQYDQFNQNVKNLSDSIESALELCDYVKLIIAYTGDGVSISAQNEIKNFIQTEIDEGDEQLQLRYIDFGPKKIEESLREEQAVNPVNEKIRIHKYRICNSTRKTIFGLVLLNDLIFLHNKYKKDKSLYAKNIRYFLGEGKRGVNSAIKTTLANHPEHFLHLNNGITMVCSSLKQRSRSRTNKTTRAFDFLGLSVVNGAQTISSAAEFVENNSDVDISNAQVMVTIINTGTDDFHKQVTKARNLQNPVDLSNFAALDDNQERLRREMALFGFDYQYRPQAQTSTGIPSINIENLAKAMACLHEDIRYPARLKLEPSQFTNFESEAYQGLFTTDLTGHKALNAYIAFMVIHNLTIQAERGTSSPEKLIYRHGGYVIAFILMKLLKNKIEDSMLLDESEVRQWLSIPFDEVRQHIADQFANLSQGAAHHSFFKRTPDTAILIIKVMIQYQGLQQDEKVIGLQGLLIQDDPYNQRLFNVLKDRIAQI